MIHIKEKKIKLFNLFIFKFFFLVFGLYKLCEEEYN
jgi:hypothetical protein